MKSTRLYLCVVMVSLMLSACSSIPNTNQNQPVNIAVIAYPDRDFNVFYDQLVNAISDDLVAKGFGVYDQNIFSLDDFNLKIGANYKPSVLEMAKAIDQPRLDYLLLLDISSVIKSGAYSKKIGSRTEASLFSVYSGRSIGNIDVLGRTMNAKPNCNNRCLKNKLQQSAVVTSGEIAAFASSNLQDSVTIPVIPVIPVKRTVKIGKEGVSPKGTTGW